MSNNKGLKKMKKIKHTKTNPKTRKSKRKRSSQKKTKKLSRRNMKQKNKKRKSKSKQTTLINGGGGCGCGASGTTSSFKNYMNELRNSLDINNLGGGGYTVSPYDTINGHKTTIKEYDDNKPPIIRSVFN